MDITPGRIVIVYLVTVPVFFLIDLVWLGLLARDFYKRHLGQLLQPEVNWFVAILFYLLFVVGIVIFAVKPALEAGSPARAAIYGALFGLFTYATYDLTNLATLRDWPVIVTVVDLMWGTALCGMVAWVSYVVSTKLV
jgi:uncharacterized membrane protein